ncbi:glycosyltransferase [Changchengzhania lutea]|uniref:glycosyltransferase n=1 Tax=Changchengzhania lutea TaxID=2049305 RepID=UPI00115DBB7A|nr:glycosyltransferase [Changchengzhania lutea]
MRVLQLIDSLDAGGAERVAVNMANALSYKIDSSYLCATRKEGLLKSSLSTKVSYLFLNKTKTIDFKAIIRLNGFIKKHDIEIIHAHSTSFFLAAVMKFFNSKLKIIWHDHYGHSEHLDKRKFLILRLCSGYFLHIISVNRILADWAKKHLKTKGVTYLPNFAIRDTSKPKTTLKGKDGKRILHLANLRPQKDHLNLLHAFSKVRKNHPDWSLHGVGKDFDDAYSEDVKNLIKTLDLDNHVFLYGSRLDITHIINQSDIGVLSSKSEGLPIALLEYGLAGLPTIATNVGNCKEVISNDSEGLLINPENEEALSIALKTYITDVSGRVKSGQHLKRKVETSFSEEQIINKLLKIYSKATNGTV